MTAIASVFGSTVGCAIALLALACGLSGEAALFLYIGIGISAPVYLGLRSTLQSSQRCLPGQI